MVFWTLSSTSSTWGPAWALIGFLIPVLWPGNPLRDGSQGNCRTYFICFWSLFCCLIHCFIISWFLVISSRRINPIPVTILPGKRYLYSWGCKPLSYTNHLIVRIRNLRLWGGELKQGRVGGSRTYIPLSVGFSREPPGDFLWRQSPESDEEIETALTTHLWQPGVRAHDRVCLALCTSWFSLSSSFLSAAQPRARSPPPPTADSKSTALRQPPSPMSRTAAQ